MRDPVSAAAARETRTSDGADDSRDESEDGLAPLANVRPGERARVLALCGGGEFQERLVSLGLFLGCEVTVLEGGRGGRMLLAVGDTRIALGHGMAGKVRVLLESQV